MRNISGFPCIPHKDPGWDVLLRLSGKLCNVFPSRLAISQSRSLAGLSRGHLCDLITCVAVFSGRHEYPPPRGATPSASHVVSD